MTTMNNAKQQPSQPNIPTQIPNCVTTMKTEVGEYIPGQSLTMFFPVQEIFLNGNGAMQGGFTAAAFDNAFGALLHLDTPNVTMATIDLHINYHRPIFVNDQLSVTVYLKAKGNNIAAMYAEGFNKDGKLIATATTNMMISDKGTA